MIELRKMENQNFRTFGWVQDPSDFESLIKVVSIFDNKSETHKELVNEKIDRLIEERDGKSHFLEVLNSIPLKIKYADLVGTSFTPRSSARCNGIVQATVKGQVRDFISDWPADNFVRWAQALGFIKYNYFDDSFEITEEGLNLTGAKTIEEKLHKAGIRVVLDDRNEKVGYKIREAQLEKVPYMLVVGAKEVEENTVSVRSRESAENEVMRSDEFISKIKYEVENKTK